MRLRSRRRPLVIRSSSAHRAGAYAVSLRIAPAPPGPVRRFLRIGALLTFVVVRPRWKPLLAGTALTVFGLVEHSGMGFMTMMPGLMLLWAAVLIPGDSDADYQRRQELMRELAAFSTTAQRRDLEAALDQYPDCVTGEIREVLSRQPY
jgi:hypothetical protein